MTERKSKLDSAFKSIVIITIVLLAIYFAGNIIMPILFSGLIAIVLVPFADLLERLKLPRGLASFITVICASILLFGIVLVVVIQGQEVIVEVPKMAENKLSSFNLEKIEIQSKAVLKFIQENSSTLEDVITQAQQVATTVLKTGLIGLKDALSFLILIPVYVFFMLLCRKHIFRFVMAFHVDPQTSQTKDQEQGMKLINGVKNSLFHYLKGLTLIMMISGTLTFLGLYFIGLDYALVLGVITAVLTPIPYIGVTISAVIPLLLAFLTKDSLWYVAGVLIVFIVVQFTENYFLTPRIMGKSVNINPLIIVIGLIVIGSLTGLIGMILTVPILAITKVIVDNYPHLKPWKYLLEDEYSEEIGK